jgi:hypothetical protein
MSSDTASGAQAGSVEEGANKASNLESSSAQVLNESAAEEGAGSAAAAADAAADDDDAKTESVSTTAPAPESILPEVSKYNKEEIAADIMKRLTGFGSISQSGKQRLTASALSLKRETAKRKRLEHLIPKDRAAWLNTLVNIVRKKTEIQYLSEK